MRHFWFSELSLLSVPGNYRLSDPKVSPSSSTRAASSTDRLLWLPTAGITRLQDELRRCSCVCRILASAHTSGPMLNGRDVARWSSPRTVLGLVQIFLGARDEPLTYFSAQTRSEFPHTAQSRKYSAPALRIFVAGLFRCLVAPHSEQPRGILVFLLHTRHCQ